MNKEKLTRREFFRTCGRTAVAGGLTALGLLLSRRKSSASGSQKCVNNGICRGCGVFASCSLPQALSAKIAVKKNKSSRHKTYSYDAAVEGSACQNRE